jgi:hypothetical protein
MEEEKKVEAEEKQAAKEQAEAKQAEEKQEQEVAGKKEFQKEILVVLVRKTKRRTTKKNRVFPSFQNFFFFVLFFSVWKNKQK